MKFMLKNPFFAVLPLLGLLLLPPVAAAHDQGWPRAYLSHSSGTAFDNHHASLNRVYWGRQRGWYGSPRYYDNGYSRQRGWSCPPRYRYNSRRDWYGGPRYYGNGYDNRYRDGYYNGYRRQWWERQFAPR